MRPKAACGTLRPFANRSSLAESTFGTVTAGKMITHLTLGGVDGRKITGLFILLLSRDGNGNADNGITINAAVV